MSESARRRCQAIAALAFLLVAVLVIDAVGKLTHQGVLSEAAVLTLDDESVSQGTSQLPEGFAQEVLPVEGYANLRVGADGSVAGFEMDGDPAQIFDELAQLLSDGGWTAVPSGNGVSGSFIKESGQYRWLDVSCVKAGDTTCVVVQCVPPDGKE